MRAAMLLIPFAAVAAVSFSAAAPPVDPYANAMPEDESMAEMNASVDPNNEMMEMELSNDTMASDEATAAAERDIAAARAAAEAALAEAIAATERALTNVAADEAIATPAWMAGGTWLYAGAEAAGPVWYFEALDADFTRRPFRVRLRTDEATDAPRLHNNTERLAEIDCAAHRYRILRTTHYDDAGRATEANERGDGRLVPVTPGSVFEQVEQTICAHAANRRGGEREVTFNGM